MSSRIAIINRACLKLGVDTIADPAENSEPARVSAALFDDVARAELRDNPWSFAIRRVLLPASAVPPAFEFARAFPLPSDNVRVVQVGEFWNFAEVRVGPLGESIVPYRIENAEILTDLPAPLRLRYVADLSGDPGQWDASFADAFVFRLAGEMCETLTKSSSKVAMLEKQHQMVLRRAKRLNAIETPPEPLPDNSWVTSRFIG